MPSAAKLLAGASGVPTDPNFRNVTLLLHGDGSNGAQNNTFIDSSTNNFTITRNGNTTQGSFSPYGSRWSNYFDGNGDYLSISNTSALDLPGDFTIEFWWNPSSLSGTQSLVGKWTFNQFAWLVQATSSNIILQTASGTGVTAISNAWSPSIGQWYHIAFTRSGTDVRAFVNGSQVGTTQTSSRTCSSTATFGIGANMDGPQEYSTGYISDLRVVKGTVVYTANFTPPITPLTAITNTSLLTCQSNRFRDASTNNFAITRNGDVRVMPFSPYAPTAPYSTATNGGSMYFDGSGDYLSVADNAALEFGSGDFTIELWAYLTATGGSGRGLISKGTTTGASFLIYQGTSNELAFYASSNGSSWDISSDGRFSDNIPLNTWHHIAVSRSGTTFRLFLNGALTASTTNSAALVNNASSVDIGAYGSITVNGYLSNVRLVKGTAVYTAAFTPPTAPVTAITNTSLLVNGTNAAIIDSTAGNDLETVGNAQISTSVKKFGTGSMAFDGSGDYLVAPSSTAFDLGSGDFTIECWFNANSFAAPFGLISRYAVTAGVSAYGWLIQVRSSTSIRLLRGNDLYFDSTVSTMSTGTWYHVAAVRNGSTFTLYLNGTQVGQATGVSNFTDASSTTLQIGRTHTVTDDLNGYIDDIRITKGVARYTANFTPPTAAFPDQ